MEVKMTQKKPDYTDDELVIRLWDKENIQKLMARHAYCYSNDQRREELTSLWVRKPNNMPTASLGHNDGYFVGMDEISRYYVADRNERLYEQLKAYSDADPSVEYSDINLGFGVSNIHTLNTPLIYIAEDRKTARYMGYDCFQRTAGKPDGSADAYFGFGLVFADLMMEDGEWRIWRLIMQTDHMVAAGTAYTDVPIHLDPAEDPIKSEYGEPTVGKQIYNPLFGWELLYQDMPRPYYSYEDWDGFGPDSKMGLSFYEREGWARYE